MTLQGAAALALPELILAGSALALLIWGAFRGRAGGLFTLAAVAALAAATVAACIGPLGRAFGGALIVDQGAVFAKVVIYAASAVAIPLGDRWFARRGVAKFEYPVLVIIAALGMSMMVSAGDLISLYVSIELQSLALYILAAFLRDNARASEAGLKYFVLGALSSGLLLYGASLVYGFAGSTRFDVIAAAMHGGAGLGALFGLVFLICGFGFKVSAAPFHMWTPDVYEGAPTPVVGFFAGAPKLAAMVLLARLLSQAFGGAGDQWRQILVAIALMSVAVGAFGGLTQNNIKRLWAYSSIATIGYVLIGLAAGGVTGIQSMLMYMILFLIDVTGFFACLAALTREGRPLETMDDFAGLMRERPGMAMCMTIFALSALGLPPLGELWGKFYVF
ncbi:MAG: NADH-quinone oxidoreductase subunit NuoN, partial [Caulobacteraceae bacterium]